MNYGYWSKLVRVNLTRKEVKFETIPENLLKKYLGGSGLASKYLSKEVPEQIDPFSPQNKVIFATGPFQGTPSPVPGSGKWAAVSKSPLTGTFAVSTAGAEWGGRLKKAGIDLLIIEGHSEQPVYLWINDGTVAIKKASHLWGRDAIESIEAIKNELDEKKVSVAAIGPAGEKKVGIACIIADSHSFVGRCGLGAVLGSKCIKAVAVKGTKSVDIAKREKLAAINRDLFKKISNNTEDTFKAHGTSVLVGSSEEVGDLPIKNWNRAVWPEGAEKLGAPHYTKKLNADSWPCMFCPVGCHRKIRTSYKGETIKGAGAEYETLGMMGSNCLIDDLDVISKANDLCNRLGIDTISAGAFVSFTMECFEKGIVSSADLDGSKADWGKGEFLLKMINQIGNNKGFGSLFKNGIKPAAEKLGKEAEKIAVEVKNLDQPAHDPRSYFSLALNYATGVRGACHLRGYTHVGEGGMTLPEIGLDEPPERFNLEAQVELTAVFQDLAALHDSLVICIFVPINGMTLTETTNILNYITGWDLTPGEIMKIGERIVTLQRKINTGDGINADDDYLPPKMFTPAEKGFRKGRVPEPFQKTLQKFYEYRGWDKKGKPKSEKLLELDISS